MKTFTQFMAESADKDTSDYAPMQLQFGAHSIDELDENYQNSDIVHAEDEKKIAPLHAALTAHYHEYDDTHKKAIKEYTTSSHAMNNSLHAEAAGKDRNGRPFDADDHKRLMPQVKRMDKLVNKTKTPADMHVYSGTQTSPARFKSPDHKPGDPIKVKIPSFTSTSISKFQAEAFTGYDEHHEHDHDPLKDHTHMLKIHVPAGHKGAYIDHHSKNKGEREFVLPRNTTLHVHDKPELQNHGSNGPIAVWHAHIVKK
jgi:hypothetical protein